MVWTELGVNYEPHKSLTTSLELNSRLNSSGLQTFFPQLAIKYKLTKWFSPGIEYRFITDKNKYSNYKTSNRLNLNANFDFSLERFTFKTRVRYQFEFNRLNGTENYNPDFDQAFRIKPSISYNIKGLKFDPEISAEWFYYPGSGGPYYPGFTKVRLAAGGTYNLKGPHEIGVKYQLDKKFHSNSGLRHVLSLSYSYDIN